MNELAEAIKYGDLEKVKSLLNSRENLNENEGENSLLCLAARGPQNLANTVNEYMTGPDHKGGYAAIASILIEAGADVNARCGLDNTPLMLAARGGAYWDGSDYAEIARIFIDAGAEINATNQRGDTALMDAAGSGNTQLARMLMDTGADVNAVNNNGDTSLIIAAEKGQAGTFKLLVDAGADINAADKNGNTSLHRAIKRSHGALQTFRYRLLEIIEPIIAAGANVNALNKEGLTPLDCVRRVQDTFPNEIEVKMEAILKPAGAIHGQKWVAELDEWEKNVEKMKDIEEILRKKNEERIFLEQKKEWREKGRCEECGNRLSVFDKLQKQRTCSDCRNR